MLKRRIAMVELSGSCDIAFASLNRIAERTLLVLANWPLEQRFSTLFDFALFGSVSGILTV